MEAKAKLVASHMISKNKLISLVKDNQYLLKFQARRYRSTACILV